MPAPRKLTETYIRSLRYEGRPYLVRDTHTTGLMIAVNKKSKTFKVQRDLWRGLRGYRRLVKTVRHTIGSADDMSLDEARSRGRQVLELIGRGIDPNAPTKTIPVSEKTVGEIWDDYERWLRRQDRSPDYIASFRYHLEKYLSDWRHLPVVDLRKAMCRERHEEITDRHGKAPANQAMWSLRAAYNYALKQDDEDELRSNPVGGVDFHRIRRREAVILPEDLADWWKRTGELPSPLRTVMHRLGLLSGLRSKTLKSLEREWIDLPGRVIRIPHTHMKSRRPFELPLSGPMVDLAQQALLIGDALYHDPRWLFPTRTNDGEEIIATQICREKKMPGETGHILRHTYRTMAERLGIPQSRARFLLDHKQPGIEAHYLHSKALREELLADQERMSAFILETANAV